MHHDTQIAVLADIHGNALALEAVLADVRNRGVARLVNLGDTFYGPLDPAGTWQILQHLNIPTILGNQDRILLEAGAQWENVPTFTAAIEGIGANGMAWLRSLPANLKMDDILLTHGTPEDDMKYLMEDTSTGLPAMRNWQDVEKDMDPEAENCTLVLAGHSHHPGMLSDGNRTVVNPGSVGLPAYSDDAPPHIMASGTPHAKYCVAGRTDAGWDVEFVSVEYDWDQAADMAKSNGREDWAEWLTTGLASL